jgi:hypothetical protein
MVHTRFQPFTFGKYWLIREIITANRAVKNWIMLIVDPGGGTLFVLDHWQKFVKKIIIKYRGRSAIAYP